MQVSILGATGYAGVELLRILHNHPEVDIAYLTSEGSTGKKISDIYGHLRGIYDQVLISIDNIEKIAAASDFIFICLPHGHAMQVGKALENTKTRIIDLGADYRFADTATYEEWYKVKHIHKNTARVYGLAELHRQEIKTAKIIGNAGCYPTASILALAPLVKQHLIDPSTIIIDAKSGASGAGRSAVVANQLPELYDNFKAYGVASHRHTPEIEQELSSLVGKNVILNFTPHLLPMARGILSTCYAKLLPGVTAEKVDDAFNQLYASEFFIRLLGRGAYPTTKNVRGSNYCDIGWQVDKRTGRVIVLSAIDNLVKGAAGQAVQNFNIACGFDEKTGLSMTPMYP
ncbi:N-acetyl-gamma-glutamyl-phosphate reductase [Pectinatus cerevisiiphilus]|uniref:N-acetyl-gamma-glutamyl-phosphate reductase n=1 Tax=Pectinatus cerevisiiphilus TaxID=86956 RepID=A0A4R3K5C6_9FIRM|nr:N-acetyl-gamma-glutamyl-phosphate reductase [Pectinatus cerevisiiphilus]TCS77983.1 N-acetyl-gamma-glutamyl-phosphate reductase [Pectinatus cerevisiiphilus]